MSTFEFISVALSIVVGLAIAQTLRGVVVVFRARREHAMAPLPLVWAFIVFITIIQLWWALFELDAAALVTEWSLGSFLLVLWLTVLLFLASALVLPGEAADLGTYFDEDGRWALAMLALYSASGVVGNALLFGAGWLSRSQLTIYAMIVVLITIMVSDRMWLRATLTAVYLGALLWALTWAAPTVYPS